MKKYDELKPDEKKEVIERLRYFEVEDDQWWDYIVEDFINEVLPIYGLTADRDSLEFDLHNFTASLTYDFKDIREVLKKNYVENDLIIDYLNEAIKIVNDEKHLYVYPPSYEDIKEEAWNYLNDEFLGTLRGNQDMFYLTGIKSEAEAIEQDMNNALFEIINKTYEDLTTDEAVEGVIIDSGFLFDENLNIV
ncbi:MAG: hypothetical protein Q8N08_05715 [Methanobacteriaceae archaeon]|nr:hypothetical protein [Methanobacteriaceae archaeon]